MTLEEVEQELLDDDLVYRFNIFQEDALRIPGTFLYCSVTLLNGRPKIYWYHIAEDNTGYFECKPISFEKAFDLAPKEYQEKILYHLNLFR